LVFIIYYYEYENKISDNTNIAEQNCGLHALLIIDMWK